MEVAIRVDASAALGIGHLRRCLSLAYALLRLDAAVILVCRDIGIDYRRHIGAAAIDLRVIPWEATASDETSAARATDVDSARDAARTREALAERSVDWIVVDSYWLDRRWHDAMRASTGAALCAIDDLADRPMAVDLLVDHNLARDHRAKYAAVIASGTRILGGPNLALLDPCYECAPAYRFNTRVDSIGIFVGGTDPWDASRAALQACRESAGFSGPIEIATTSANPHLTALQTLGDADVATRVLVDEPNLAAFFARHDIQIGAGGGAALERCRVGAPTVAIVLAANQWASLEGLAAASAVRLAASVDAMTLGPIVAALIDSPCDREELSRRARTLVDGRGALRIALALMSERIALRRATGADAETAYGWRNAEPTRRHSHDSGLIGWSDHVAWWEACLVDRTRHLLVATCGGRDVGIVRLDVSAAEAMLSFYLDPDLHGLGLGTALLRQSVQWGREHLCIDCVTADVLESNVASARAFAAAGFRRLDGGLRWDINLCKSQD